eukprot:12588778-Heterocapsa_arctica.AAC.1
MRYHWATHNGSQRNATGDSQEATSRTELGGEAASVVNSAEIGWTGRKCSNSERNCVERPREATGGNGRLNWETTGGNLFRAVT